MIVVNSLVVNGALTILGSCANQLVAANASSNLCECRHLHIIEYPFIHWGIWYLGCCVLSDEGEGFQLPGCDNVTCPLPHCPGQLAQDSHLDIVAVESEKPVNGGHRPGCFLALDRVLPWKS